MQMQPDFGPVMGSSSGLLRSGSGTMAETMTMPFQAPGPQHQSSGYFEPPQNLPGPSVQRRDSGSPKKRGPLSTSDTEGEGQNGRQKVKKKKASRACIHCQKAHLTCDDSRPCQRCTKRGIAETCVEGQRKKAKYLLDVDEPAAPRGKDRGKQPEVPSILIDSSLATTQPIQRQTGPTGMDARAATANLFPNPSASDPFFNLTLDPSYAFGSTAANMEYSILSAMLGNPSPRGDLNTRLPSPPPSTTVTHFQPQNAGWPNLPMDANANSAMNYLNPPPAPPIEPPQNPMMAINAGQGQQQQQEVVNSLAPPTPPTSDFSPALSDAVVSHHQHQQDSTEKSALDLQRVADAVYTTVTEPFDYVDGYHFLMQYLQGRFEKMDILRIVRALAIIRPSLIALQMPLTRDDEIFVERSFQRSMIELEKLISFSGTPTAVWRRTGEVCLVGVEFVMLTGWSRSDLVEKQRFIYELFEHQSVVEYWERFSAHAFEGSSPTVHSHCVLMKPSGEPIPCGFCFTIRRDVFDLPNIVIGQWLPLL